MVSKPRRKRYAPSFETMRYRKTITATFSSIATAPMIGEPPAAELVARLDPFG